MLILQTDDFDRELARFDALGVRRAHHRGLAGIHGNDSTDRYEPLHDRYHTA